MKCIGVYKRHRSRRGISWLEEGEVGGKRVMLKWPKYTMYIYKNVWLIKDNKRQKDSWDADHIIFNLHNNSLSYLCLVQFINGKMISREINILTYYYPR